jgi:hypothetical protein
MWIVLDRCRSCGRTRRGRSRTGRRSRRTWGPTARARRASSATSAASTRACCASNGRGRRTSCCAAWSASTARASGPRVCRAGHRMWCFIPMPIPMPMPTGHTHSCVAHPGADQPAGHAPVGQGPQPGHPQGKVGPRGGRGMPSPALHAAPTPHTQPPCRLGEQAARLLLCAGAQGGSAAVWERPLEEGGVDGAEPERPAVPRAVRQRAGPEPDARPRLAPRGRAGDGRGRRGVRHRRRNHVCSVHVCRGHLHTLTYTLVQCNAMQCRLMCPTP